MVCEAFELRGFSAHRRERGIVDVVALARKLLLADSHQGLTGKGVSLSRRIAKSLAASDISGVIALARLENGREQTKGGERIRTR